MKFSLFRVNDNLRTYTFPIAKIAICLILIFFLINRNRFFYIEKTNWRFIIGAISFVIGIACILCIYISVAEIIVVNDKKTENCAEECDSTENAILFSVEAIISLVDKNDIIEIIIQSNGKVVNVGASSDCKNSNSKFYNKRLFIGNTEYENIEIFRNDLLPYSDNGQLLIVEIDGVSPLAYDN